MKLMVTLAAAFLLIALVLPSVGCAGKKRGDRITARDVRGNMTPALDSIGRTTDQDYNNYARVIDNNTRAAWNDLARFLLIQETSDLGPYYMP